MFKMCSSGFSSVGSHTQPVAINELATSLFIKSCNIINDIYIYIHKTKTKNTDKTVPNTRFIIFNQRTDLHLSYLHRVPQSC